MKIFLIILTALWTSFWIYAGIGIFKDTPYQIQQDKEFIKKIFNHVSILSKILKLKMEDYQIIESFIHGKEIILMITQAI